MSAQKMNPNYGSFEDICNHSVYPQGAPPLERVACNERGNGYDARDIALADASKDMETIRAVSKFGRECLELMSRILGRAGFVTDTDRAALRRIAKKKYPREWLLDSLRDYCGFDFHKDFGKTGANAFWIARRIDEDYAHKLARDAEQARAAERCKPMRRADFTDAQWARLSEFNRRLILKFENEGTDE